VYHGKEKNNIYETIEKEIQVEQNKAGKRSIF
jgi:hypothetical protein